METFNIQHYQHSQQQMMLITVFGIHSGTILPGTAFLRVKMSGVAVLPVAHSSKTIEDLSQLITFSCHSAVTLLLCCHKPRVAKRRYPGI